MSRLIGTIAREQYLSNLTTYRAAAINLCRTVMRHIDSAHEVGAEANPDYVSAARALTLLDGFVEIEIKRVGSE